MSLRLSLTLLCLLLPAGPLLAQAVRPVYEPPVEELPVPEELPAPPAAGPAMVEREPALAGEPPALLGVHVVPLTRQLLAFYGPDLRHGVVIDSISQGSPADIYRLPIGGAIVAVDNIQINEPADLSAAIGMYAPGEFVSIIYHDGRQFTERRVRLAPRIDIVGPNAPRPVVPRIDPPLVLTPSEDTEAELLPAMPAEEMQEELVLSEADVQLILSELEDLRERSAAIEAEIQSLEAILRSQER